MKLKLFLLTISFFISIQFVACGFLDEESQQNNFNLLPPPRNFSTIIGNGRIDPPTTNPETGITLIEECDDRNTLSGDGCSDTGHIEDGFVCIGAGRNACHASEAPAVCGNAQIETDEVCDDGNTRDDDTCSFDCKRVFAAQVVPEENVSEDPVCGNGRTEAGEQCDDQNIANGDGCSSVCQTEASPLDEERSSFNWNVIVDLARRTVQHFDWNIDFSTTHECETNADCRAGGEVCNEQHLCDCLNSNYSRGADGGCHVRTVCGAGQRPNEQGQCEAFTCPEDQWAAGTICVARCTAGTIWNPNTEQCLSNCSAVQEWVDNECVPRCAVNQFRINGSGECLSRCPDHTQLVTRNGVSSCNVLTCGPGRFAQNNTCVNAPCSDPAWAAQRGSECHINTVEVTIQTADIENAGTDGNIAIRFCPAIAQQNYNQQAVFSQDTCQRIEVSNAASVRYDSALGAIEDQQLQRGQTALLRSNRYNLQHPSNSIDYFRVANESDQAWKISGIKVLIHYNDESTFLTYSNPCVQRWLAPHELIYFSRNDTSLCTVIQTNPDDRNSGSHGAFFINFPLANTNDQTLFNGPYKHPLIEYDHGAAKLALLPDWTNNRSFPKSSISSFGFTLFNTDNLSPEFFLSTNSDDGLGLLGAAVLLFKPGHLDPEEQHNTCYNYDKSTEEGYNDLAPHDIEDFSPYTFYLDADSNNRFPPRGNQQIHSSEECGFLQDIIPTMDPPWLINTYYRF